MLQQTRVQDITSPITVLLEGKSLSSLHLCAQWLSYITRIHAHAFIFHNDEITVLSLVGHGCECAHALSQYTASARISYFLTRV